MSTIRGIGVARFGFALERNNPNVVGNYYNIDIQLSRERVSANLWTRSRYLGMGDSTSDPNCPDAIMFAPVDWRGIPIWTHKGGTVYRVLYRIQGITKDSAGTPLGYCTVQLFRTSDNLLVDSIHSDSVGNYLVYTPYAPPETHYCVARKSPDVAGITANTLTGVA